MQGWKIDKHSGGETKGLFRELEPLLNLREQLVSELNGDIPEGINCRMVVKRGKDCDNEGAKRYYSVREQTIFYEVHEERRFWLVTTTPVGCK